jgi:hypothetical protein
MMHHFLFETGEWLGEGQITLTASSDVLRFRTKWIIALTTEGDISCTQIVEVIGGDRIENRFVIEKEEEGAESFAVTLENEAIGTAAGKGIIDGETVAWEFRSAPVLDGYEIYERIGPNEYAMRAEYLADDLTRTQINGRIWRRLSQT